MTIARQHVWEKKTVAECNFWFLHEGKMDIHDKVEGVELGGRTGKAQISSEL